MTRSRGGGREGGVVTRSPGGGVVTRSQPGGREGGFISRILAEVL